MARGYADGQDLRITGSMASQDKTRKLSIAPSRKAEMRSAAGIALEILRMPGLLETRRMKSRDCTGVLRL